MSIRPSTFMFCWVWGLMIPNLASAGLVAHYELNGNANDSSGFGNHGTLTGGPNFVASPRGQAIAFNNPVGFGIADELMLLPNNFGALDNASFSIALLMRSVDNSQINGRLFGNNFSAAGMGFGYNREHSSNAGIFMRDTAVNGPSFFDNTAGPEGYVVDGNWHWLVLVVDRTAETATAWIDGHSQTQSIAGLGATSFANLRLGALDDINSSTGDAFGARNTWVDDLRIYNHALSAAEVGALAVPEPSAGLLTGAVLLASLLVRTRGFGPKQVCASSRST